MKKRVVVICQCREGSSRLPGKALKKVQGKSLIEHLIHRVRRSRLADSLVIAIPQKEKGGAIQKLCEKLNCPCFLGADDDVFSRYLEAAKAFSAEIVVRITGDCPLICPELIDEMLAAFFKESDCDYFSNVIERSFPKGLDIEIVPLATLEKLKDKTLSAFDKEHVTYYIYQHPKEFKLKNYALPKSESQPELRVCVDTQEDFDFVEQLFQALSKQNPNFSYREILAYATH